MESATVLYAKKATTIAAVGTTNTGSILIDRVDLLAIDIVITAVGGVSPTITFEVQRESANGTFHTMATTAALTAAGSTTLSVGPGTQNNHALTDAIRVNFVVGGATPTVTFDLSVIGSSVG